MANDLSVRLTKVVNAPVEEVFNAWLSAKMLSKFMLPAPGMPEPRVECNGEKGGSFTIYMMVGDKEIPHKGTYLEVDKFNKLAFTWESPFSTDGSTVTILFESLDNNRTKLDFIHVKFLSEQERNDHKGGWTQILEKLDETLSTAKST